MAGLLIIAHAPLASSLKTVAAHVFPNEAGIEAVIRSVSLHSVRT